MPGQPASESRKPVEFALRMQPTEYTGKACVTEPHQVLGDLAPSISIIGRYAGNLVMSAKQNSRHTIRSQLRNAGVGLMSPEKHKTIRYLFRHSVRTRTYLLESKSAITEFTGDMAQELGKERSVSFDRTADMQSNGSVLRKGQLTGGLVRAIPERLHGFKNSGLRTRVYSRPIIQYATDSSGRDASSLGNIVDCNPVTRRTKVTQSWAPDISYTVGKSTNQSSRLIQ